MSIRKSIYEHLITKKKYNTLEMNFELLKADLEDKIYENKQLRRQLQLKDNVWETRVIELEKKLSKKKVVKTKEVKNEKKKEN